MKIIKEITALQQNFAKHIAKDIPPDVAYTMVTGEENIAKALEWYDNISVQDLVGKIRQNTYTRLQTMDYTFVISRLCSICQVDYAELFDADGNPRNINELPDNARQAISAVTTSEFKDKAGNSYITTKVQLHDKLRALEMLGKYLGIFEKKESQSSGTETIEQYIRRLEAGE